MGCECSVDNIGSDGFDFEFGRECSSELITKPEWDCINISEIERKTIVCRMLYPMSKPAIRGMSDLIYEIPPRMEMCDVNGSIYS